MPRTTLVPAVQGNGRRRKRDGVQSNERGLGKGRGGVRGVQAARWTDASLGSSLPGLSEGGLPVRMGMTEMEETSASSLRRTLHYRMTARRFYASDGKNRAFAEAFQSSFVS